MKNIRIVISFTAVLATQASAQSWRRSLQNLPERPASGVTVRDIESVEEDLRMGAPFLGAAAPENWEANRDLVRRTITYLSAVRAMTGDPLVRTALMRTFRMVTAMRLAYPENQNQPTPPPQPIGPRTTLVDTVGRGL